ncbi:putative CRISPR-associated protein [Desulfonema magnum]|uniref:CRISPR-associated domain-containing protein n=1 Tax=Desulfonema magnum TaxID=45655 RepID=A0A975BVM0_9BACT|nr:putative CRISPR-associated protein [Desulfonema magnum]QTA92049.1 Putative CRISPR-associated domain-containing protein [Desulfonema magnum]
MSKLVAITTVGTALLTNTNNWLGRKYENLLDITDKEIEAFVQLNVANKTETRISAEINSAIQLNAYFNERENRNIDIVHLILSETEVLKKEEPLLKAYFKNKGFEVHAQIIEGLKYKESQFKMSGLRSLVNNLTHLIDDYKNKGFRVVMNATGGFKAETAYATVLAQLRHIESYYIYETFNEIVPLPHLPLNLDIEYWARFKKIFELYERGLNDRDSDNCLRSVPSGFSFLIEKNEKERKWFLNPAGETFYLSLLSEEEVYLKTINEKMVFKKTKETTLWLKAQNKHVQTLKDIPDNDVKNLLRRVLRLGFVRKIELVDFHQVGVGQPETCLKYKRKNEDSMSHYVQYEIRCKLGRQVINIMVDKGFCGDLIFMIGKKACV